MRARVFLTLTFLTIGSVVVGADAAAGGGGCHEPVTVRPQATMTIAMENFCVRPGVAQVQVGDTVEVVNKDAAAHNLYGPDWYHGDLQPGESARRTFDEPGTYTFACTLHPGMTGAVIVGEPQLLAARRPLASSDDGGGSSTLLVLAMSAALLLCASGGWALGRVTRSQR